MRLCGWQPMGDPLPLPAPMPQPPPRCTCSLPSPLCAFSGTPSFFLLQEVSATLDDADEDFIKGFQAAENPAEAAATRQKQSHMLDAIFGSIESMNDRED